MNAPHSRRAFLAAVAGTGAALVARPARAFDDAPRVAKLVADTLGVDTHNHIDVPLKAAEGPGPDLDIAGELTRSGLAAICATFAVERPALNGPGDAYDQFQAAMKALDAQLARNQIRRALGLKDLKAAHAAGKPAVVQAVEGATSSRASRSGSRRPTSEGCASWACSTTTTPRRRWATSTRTRPATAG